MTEYVVRVNKQYVKAIQGRKLILCNPRARAARLSLHQATELSKKVGGTVVEAPKISYP